MHVAIKANARRSHLGPAGVYHDGSDGSEKFIIFDLDSISFLELVVPVLTDREGALALLRCPIVVVLHRDLPGLAVMDWVWTL